MRDVHKPQLSPGSTVNGHQDPLVSLENLEARGCQDLSRLAGQSSRQASEMPGSPESWPQVPQVSIQATDQLAPRACKRVRPFASGGRRAQCHPRKPPEQFRVVSPHARHGERAEGQHGRVQPSYGNMEGLSSSQSSPCSPCTPP